MTTICEQNKCNGCMACKAVCAKGAIDVRDETRAFNAYINEDKCVRCGLCKSICPQNNRPELNSPIKWWQGWANDEGIRRRSSSGGVAAELLRSFISRGGYVCSCVFKQGKFIFDITNDISRVQDFVGSKYVKSDPGLIYKDIEKLLKNGEKVLFIGLPCQSAGLKNCIPDRLHKNLYRVDLICHGSPSYNLLNKHIQELGYKFEQIESISFREKTGWKFTIPYNKDRTFIDDSYLTGFLSGIFYTENCYECAYSGVNRTSDITLGDSWGSDLKDELKKGLSLIMCQSEKGIELIQSSDIHIESVDKDVAIASNQQLKHPFKKTAKTSRFFRTFFLTKHFGLSFFLIEPKKVFRQQLKYILIKLHLYKPPRRGGKVG